MSAKKTQISVIFIAIVLLVLLYIAPKTTDKATLANEAVKNEVETVNMDAFLKEAVRTLRPEDKAVYELHLKKAEQASSQYSWLDSIVAFWDKNKHPDIAAIYTEKRASVSKLAKDWFKAGDRYYYSVQFTKDNNEVPVLFQKARFCYEQGLQIDPTSTEAKIQLASCWVEGSSDPMKGIGMLREVEKTDSNNIKLQLNLAFFSVKSGQWDKAIKRFEKVLAIDSNYVEAYLHLADAYEQQGNKSQTITMLERYVLRTPDVTAREEVRKYIQQLKNK